MIDVSELSKTTPYGHFNDHNTERPHSAIGYQSPAVYAASLHPQRPSPPEPPC